MDFFSTSKSKISSSSSKIQESQVIYFWQAYNGIRQAYIVSKKQYEKPTEDQTVTAPIVGLFLPACKDLSPSGLTYPNSSHNLRIIPDKSTYKSTYFGFYSGFVFCNFFNKDGSPFQHCPRQQLEMAILQLGRMGYEAKTGFEIEFVILNPNMQPIDNTSISHLDSTIQQGSKLIQVSSTLEGLGIPIDVIHKESGRGQYEYVMDYDSPMKSIDNYHIARQVIKYVFQQNQYNNSGSIDKMHDKVCFLPKILEDDLGNGLHVHLSLWKNGKNILGDRNSGRYGLSAEGEHFMAGILYHYNALIHFLAPSPNSLKRLQPDFCVGAYKFWGIENREAPIRLIEPDKAGDVITHFEVKTLDHTANQYLAIAAILVAGMEGLKNKMLLPSPYNNDPSLLSEQERIQLNITQLPMTFEERKQAMYSLEGKPFIDFFGKDLIQNIFAFQTIDYNECGKLTLEEEVKLLVDKY